MGQFAKGLASGRWSEQIPPCEGQRILGIRGTGGVAESPSILGTVDTYEEEGLRLERRTGKRRKKRVKQIKKDRRQTRKWVSRTDPESGHMKRPGSHAGNITSLIRR